MTAAHPARKALHRWLAKAAPSEGHKLALSVAGLTDVVVQEWSRSQYDSTPSDVLAGEILGSSDGHAESVGRECRYTVRWLNVDGLAIVAMQWRSGDGMERALDGSPESQIAQLQRHLEANAKLTAIAISQNLEVTQQLIAAQQARIAHLEGLRDAYEAARTAEALSASDGKSSKLEETLLKLLPGMVGGAS